MHVALSRPCVQTPPFRHGELAHTSGSHPPYSWLYIPLFLSSSRGVTDNDGDETSFTVPLTPPLNISDQAKKVTAYIDSATVPYSFPNVTSSTGTVVVRIPLGAGRGHSGDVTLTLPTGVYTQSVRNLSAGCMNGTDWRFWMGHVA